MKHLLILALSLCFLSCDQQESKAKPKVTSITSPTSSAKTDPSKVQVLNVGSFHMDYTTDGHSEDYDETSDKSRKEIKELATKLAAFKPTVILVEIPPQRQAQLEHEYTAFKNSDTPFKDYYGEIGLVAFEVGRQCDVNRIYGIDHKVNYNFMIADQMIADHPSSTYTNFRAESKRKFNDNEAYEKLSLTLITASTPDTDNWLELIHNFPSLNWL